MRVSQIGLVTTRLEKLHEQFPVQDMMSQTGQLMQYGSGIYGYGHVPYLLKKKIQKVICDYFNLPIESIQSHTRKREIVQARQLAMYFAKKMTKSSLAIIGLQCGNKDHATVLHACKTVTNLTETDKKFRFWVEELEKKFKQ